jgi:hypothetical protein
MPKVWLVAGLLAAATSAGCHSPAIETGATPSRDKASGVMPTDANASALSVVDGIVVTPVASNEQAPGPRPTDSDTTPLFVIDGVPVTPLASSP